MAVVAPPHHRLLAGCLLLAAGCSSDQATEPTRASDVPARAEVSSDRGSRFLDPSGPLGGVYVISAVKQANAMRPDWSRSSVAGRKLVPAAYPKLSARIAHFPRTYPSVPEAPSDGVEDAG